MSIKELSEAFRKALVDVLIPEIKELRKEMTIKFEEVNKRFEELYKEMDKRFLEIHKEINELKGEWKATNKILERILDKLDLAERVVKLEDRVELILRDLEIIKSGK